MKKILMITTGGTICSVNKGSGLAPELTGEDIINYMPSLEELCEFKIINLMSIDSTNMTPKKMGEIALCIDAHYDDFDGFVVTHGTDTMAYTASALTYMLHGLNKPVVVTGSQKSIATKHSDARRNVSDAFIFACENISGVFISFHGNIILGTRAKKVKTKSFNAFSNINYPPIAFIEYGELRYNESINPDNIACLFYQHANKGLKIMSKMCEDVIVIKLFPGIDTKIFEYISQNYKGVIIESFGIGGIPSNENNVATEIKKLIDLGIAVVITTQCLEEGVDFNVYEVSHELSKMNIIYSGDMNTEAIVMKLMWSLGNYDHLGDIKNFVESTIWGDTK